MQTPRPHPEFEFVRATPVASLNVEVQEFRHRGTGAPHLHVAAKDDQNVFTVAFRTVPQDSTGVAHILEHTALCGSHRFPVRDPFFMMTRRSLNTFMNAFTSSDWTAYPFASRNRKDFYNLMEVYLDAVFFPNLDPLDFAQEGHRVEFAKSDDPNSDLLFKGVVFNEMKGAMSSPASVLYQKLTEYLFPTVTYHYNSGGEPEAIPDLSYDQLKAFHARHYHPSNAIFMTYGDIPAEEHQRYFQEYALNRFQAESIHIRVPDERRYSHPVEVTDYYALEGEKETAEKTHIVLGWLLGCSTDIREVMEAHLLSGVLLDNGASPLRHALETTDLGTAPSPLCGLQDSSKEMIFAAGLEGSEPDRAEAVERLILDVVREVAENGVDKEMVEAVLHQLEFSQREISGDHYPYGLSLILHALSPFVHDADPVAAINIDPVLNDLREKIRDPGYIKGLARRLLENNHRVRLALVPDPDLAERKRAAEATRLAAMTEAMAQEERQRVVEQAQALAERQHRQDDPEILPKVTLGDIPADLPIPEGEVGEISGMKSTWFSRGTNGLVYQEVVVDLPDLAPDLLDTLPIFCNVLGELGSGGRDYLATQALQAAKTGGVGSRATVRASVSDLGSSKGVFVVSGKALARNHAALTDLVFETFQTVRFDELKRLRELVAQERLAEEQGVVQRGHSLAMVAASAALSPSAELAHRWNGLAGIKALKSLDEILDDPGAMEGLVNRLERLNVKLAEAPRQLLLIGEEEHRTEYEEGIRFRWEGPGPNPHGEFQLRNTLNGPVRQAWTTSTQVNFCSRAYPAVPADHPDAPALMVLAGFLRNNFLHRAIREQGGAYGGGASYDGDAGAFRFYSYRDPRLAETLADFDRSVQWLLSESHPWRLIEEAILGVVSSIDKPGSPAGEAKKAFHAALHGRTPEQRRRFRQRVLEVRVEDLKRVGESYLRPENAQTAVVTNEVNLGKSGLDLEVVAL